MISTLHRRFSALLALVALASFVSGAGLDTLAVIPAAVLLFAAMLVEPRFASSRAADIVWRGAALLLAVRAVTAVITNTGDPVLPMVDLLLALLCAETWRVRDGAGDARHFALTFALLIASAAYRPGPLFGLLFVAYVMCATVALLVGYMARQARVHHTERHAPRPRFLARIASLSSVVVGVSVIVFLFFPRVSRGWAARDAPPITRSTIGFSDRVSIGDHGARLISNPEVVLRVEFPNGPPTDVTGLHWRGRSYNRFDGVAWSRSERGYSAPIEASTWGGELIEQVVYARELGGTSVLFGLHPVVDITAASRIRVGRVAAGDWLYIGDVDPVYRVRSRTGRPTAERLRGVTINRPDELRVQRASGASVVLGNLQVPPLSERIVALADSFRSAAATPYDHALMIERYLRTQFRYTLDLPATRREATLDYFLFQRRAGHCEYFSTAMAVLLRAGGIPTRNVNGFMGGEWNEFGKFLSVTQNSAHSWVEVFFPGVGWVEFDPTPGGAIGGAAGSARFAALRSFFSGAEFRWGKWILDYDLDKQAAFVDRAASAFTPRPSTSPDGETGGIRWFWMALTGAVVVLAAWSMLRRVRITRSIPHAAATRHYLRLRKSYEKLGIASASALPPLGFLNALGESPGAASARDAVNIYLNARFGGATLSRDESRTLEQLVNAARLELKRHSIP